MEITLCTNGHKHFIISYGKNDRSIVLSPISILKKIIRASCFDVIHPKNDPTKLPLIKLKEEYIRYIELGENSKIINSQQETTYKIKLCFRRGDLLQYFSKKWDMKLLKISDIIYNFRDLEKHQIGARFDNKGIQFFIDAENILNINKRINGKTFYYPFLFTELEENIKSLKKQADLFRQI